MIPAAQPDSVTLVAIVPCAYQHLYTDMSQYDSVTALCIQTMRALSITVPYGSLPDEAAYNTWVDAGNIACPVSD
jgi:hypothetical protein